jgi:putative heme iron utilization protein
MVFNPDFANSPTEDVQVNQLLKYLQHQPPEVLELVAKSASSQIKQIISQNVQGMLGMLPSEHFNVQITTDRENLAGMLASAMMTGYFLRQMEQRMELEETFTGSLSLPSNQASGEKSDSDK